MLPVVSIEPKEHIICRTNLHNIHQRPVYNFLLSIQSNNATIFVDGWLCPQLIHFGYCIVHRQVIFCALHDRMAVFINSCLASCLQGLHKCKMVDSTNMDTSLVEGL
jgi:hypothetical protein